MDKRDLAQHISQQFNAELEKTRNTVMEMGGLVEQQLADAITALTEGDAELARKVVSNDWRVNSLEVQLDEVCLHILARRQPAASDLRLVIAVIKAISDLERIGDESERIGRMALKLAEQGARRHVPAELESLGNHVRQMLHDALDAFARMDVEQAVAVAREDAKADRQYDEVVRQLLERMMGEPGSVPRVMDLIWAARSLERIGDRACNICEYVVYFVKGKDVRHIGIDEMAERAGYGPKRS
jgi:phosphate transport system regulatory protein PhoU